MKVRFWGLCLTLGAVLIAYWEIYEPLHNAALHLGSVKVSMKGAVAIPLCLLFGVGLTIGGPTFLRAVESGPTTPAWMGKSSGLGWILFAVSVAGGLALHFWLRHELSVLGYSFNV
jgi:hypothetical protein